ncbi:MAG: YciI family protein [Acholeplasma sp.]|jgi:hypothetical protein|nr:YciI family protein [Acholeplasma sp.]
MLFMMIIKASKNSEAANLPDKKLMLAMDDYNDLLDSAGVKVMAKGLQPSSNGLRFSFTTPGEPAIITEGPFENPSTLVAGFFLIDVKSKEEAIYWAKKAPDPQGNGEGQIELRHLY